MFQLRIILTSISLYVVALFLPTLALTQSNPYPTPEPADDCQLSTDCGQKPDGWCTGQEGEVCSGSSATCVHRQSGNYCSWTCSQCQGNTCSGGFTLPASPWTNPETGQCHQAWWCSAGTGNWQGMYQIHQCGYTPPGPTDAPTGTPTPPTITPTPPFRFQGSIYHDANAAPQGIGGNSNICLGNTSVGANTLGSIRVQRTGETKTQSLGSGIGSYSITTNTTNADYQLTLNLPYPPPDPENAWVCACNADPSDQYRCLYTGQQPSQANSQTHFYVKRANTSNTAWFQTLGGSSFAFGSIESKIPFATCTPPVCIPALIATDPAGTVDSPGFALTNTGTVLTSDTGGIYIHEAGGRSNAQQAEALGVSVPKETYDHFFAKFGGGAQPLAKAGKPVIAEGIGIYRYSGNLTLDSTNPWSLSSSEQIIVFVNGNLTIDDVPGGQNRITTVAPGGSGFLMFIVSGNITVTSDVGYTNIYTNPAAANIANLEGVFVADGTLTIAGQDGATDRKFIGAGTFVGWEGIVLGRNYDQGGNPQLNNAAPTEVFIFRPDFIVNAPRQVKSAQMTWRELEPSFSF